MARDKTARRPYRERGQIAERQKLGLLEKHKDYVARARDYHSKQRRLKSMREKARLRNPDEFYHKMINTQTKGGVHVSERTEVFSPETIKLLKTQDANYITLKTTQEKRKIERLQSSLHLIKDADTHQSAVGDDADDDDLDDLGDGGDTAVHATALPRGKHTIFVDSEEDVQSFDAAKHFDTLPELVNRKSNRLRTATLAEKPLFVNDGPVKLATVEKLRAQSYQELQERLKRAKALERAGRELQTQRLLAGKGRRKKVGTDDMGLPVYRWAAERKK